jgi:protoporphyrinogen oxidase
MKTAIIGGGPAGLTSAYVLTQAGMPTELYEAGGAVGGMARSIRWQGQTVDLGPHRFFSCDQRVNQLWLDVVQRDYVMVRRLTRILYRGDFYHYPLQPLDALAKLGPLEAVRCVASYASEQLRPTPPNGAFENWVCNRFGRRLFEIFFQTYSEKLWGIACGELDADFAAQRIKQFSLSAALKSAFFGNHSQHRTLVDEFAYPTGGTGMVYERMAGAVRARGGAIYLETPVQRILTERNTVKGIELKDGSVRKCDHVISTMPLTLLVERLAKAPPSILEAARQLSFRNTVLVYLEVAGRQICPDQWIYVHSPELRTGRITNFRNWSPQLCGGSPNTILSLEYWCGGKRPGQNPKSGFANHSDRSDMDGGQCRNNAPDDDDLWNWTDERLIALARAELLATTLVNDQSHILNGMVYRIPRCYPVYRYGYKDLLRPIGEYLSGIEGLQVIGRYGAFKYNNQDHSILMGILAAENLLKNAGADLWNVNADYDTYQEGWQVTKTGLVPTH